MQQKYDFDLTKIANRRNVVFVEISSFRIRFWLLHWLRSRNNLPSQFLWNMSTISLILFVSKMCKLRFYLCRRVAFAFKRHFKNRSSQSIFKKFQLAVIALLIFGLLLSSSYCLKGDHILMQLFILHFSFSFRSRMVCWFVSYVA